MNTTMKKIKVGLKIILLFMPLNIFLITPSAKPAENILLENGIFSRTISINSYIDAWFYYALFHHGLTMTIFLVLQEKHISFS